MSASRPSSSSLLFLLIVIVVAWAGYRFLTMPDHRSVTDKLGDAIHDLPNGADKASRDLQDRTPGQKLGDAVKDAGDKIKDETSGR